MNRIKRLIKISLKSIIKKNRGNKLLLVSVCILFLIPTLLYNTTESIVMQVEKQNQVVFGMFTDIYYRDNVYEKFEFTDSDMQEILPEFNYDSYGAFYTVLSVALNDNKNMNIGYADDEALKLACMTKMKGHMPTKENEIALAIGVAELLGNKNVGDKVLIAETEYTIVGTFDDFGHLWPRGEVQFEKNISPVNAFVTREQAKSIYDENWGIRQQILIKRTMDKANSIEGNEQFFVNNNVADNETAYEIPNSFMILMYSISILVMISLLLLNKNRLSDRLKTYYSLGMKVHDIRFLSKFELIFICFIGMAVGVFLGFIFSFIILQLVSSNIEIDAILSWNIPRTMMLYIAMMVGFCVIIFLYINAIIKNTISEVNTYNTKMYRLTKHRISIFKFDIHQNYKILASVVLLITFVCILLSYGVFYGRYFKGDALELTSGFVPRDYDFQFVSTLQSSAPIDTDIKEGEEQKFPVFFMDTYEKCGADKNFVNVVRSKEGVEKVIAYRENTKINALVKKDKIDRFIDGSDFYFDNGYNKLSLLRIANLDKINSVFGYQEDEILVKSEVIGYPQSELEKLERSVIEGKIDMEKILAGEEIILRAPAYELSTRNDEYGEVVSKKKVDYLSETATNLTEYEVGDEITLTGILTDEWINGPVLDHQLESFYRYDVNVKVGAIIRSNDGELPTSNNSVAAAFSILTVNEAFEKLGIPADYSVISVYTKNNANMIELSSIMSGLSTQVPYMKLENWQSDVKTYKTYNVLVSIFSITLICILVLVTLILLISQFYMKSQHSLKTYSLYRINGLSYNSLLYYWNLQVLICFLLGSIISLPLSKWFIKKTFNVFDFELEYYFPTIDRYIIIAVVFFLVILAIIPSMRLLRKRKNNIVIDIY